MGDFHPSKPFYQALSGTVLGVTPALLRFSLRARVALGPTRLVCGFPPPSPLNLPGLKLCPVTVAGFTTSRPTLCGDRRVSGMVRAAASRAFDENLFRAAIAFLKFSRSCTFARRRALPRSSSLPVYWPASGVSCLCFRLAPVSL